MESLRGPRWTPRRVRDPPRDSASPAAAHRFPDACVGERLQLAFARDRRPSATATRRPTGPRVQQRDRHLRRLNAASRCAYRRRGRARRHPDRRSPAARSVRLGRRSSTTVAVQYTVAVNAGVPDAVARGTATFTCTTRRPTHTHDHDDLGDKVTRPALSLAVTANPATGIVAAERHLRLPADQHQPTAAPIATRSISAACAPLACASGDTNADDLLDNGEAWQYSCRACYDGAGLRLDASRPGTSTVDTRTVSSPRDADVVPRSRRRARDDADPAASPATGVSRPSRPTYTYAVLNDERRRRPPGHRRHDRRRRVLSVPAPRATTS